MPILRQLLKKYVKKLQREKEEMLAKKETADARIKIQESLDGFSVDADVQALENVRTSIKKRVAEADINTELEDNSIDKRLNAIKAKTGNVRARQQLEELKKLKAAKAEAAAGKKTI